MGAPGCDDAPVVEIAMSAALKKLTYIIPYYENPDFLRRQIEVWCAYAPRLRDHLSVIVVDDGSPNNPASGVLRRARFQFQVRLFRIEVDVRWNWLAARNIGAHVAGPGCWLMLTDMDHVVTESTLDVLTRGEFDPNVIYRFSRRECDQHGGLPIHPHPNSWFMTREMYWRVGGYDEALSGHYGTDGDYRRRCAATAPIRIMSAELVRHEYVGDSSTTHYKRKQPEDAGKKAILKTRRPGWRPKVLSFPYHEVAL